MTAEIGKKVVLEIDDKFRRYYETLRRWTDNGCKGDGTIVNQDSLYSLYCELFDRLFSYLSDKIIETGYGSELQVIPFKIIGLDGWTATMEISDSPFDVFWATVLIDMLDERYRFGGYAERMRNDP